MDDIKYNMQQATTYDLPVQCEVVVSHTVVGSVDLSVEGHDEGYSMLCNRVG